LQRNFCRRFKIPAYDASAIPYLIPFKRVGALCEQLGFLDGHFVGKACEFLYGHDMAAAHEMATHPETPVRAREVATFLAVERAFALSHRKHDDFRTLLEKRRPVCLDSDIAKKRPGASAPGT
jgi:hypothetical protein